MVPILLSILLAVPGPVEAISTRCRTEVVHLFPATTPGAAGFDAQRLVACGDEYPDDALWQLDRLESADGSLDGRYARRRANALVYVLDTGVESNHDEFADGNVIAGIDIPKLYGDKPGCTGATNEALHPCYAPIIVYAAAFSHGTGVASVIGGRRVGVAPGASIVSVYGVTDKTDRFIRALDEIVRNAWDPATPQVRTAIINMSSQLPGNDADPLHPALEQKIRDMVGGVDAQGNPDPVNGKRFLFVVSAGNADVPVKAGAARGQCSNTYDVTLYPATLGPSIEGLITVGGSSKDDHLWSDSCRGAAVELLAPAEAAVPAINSGRDHYRLSLSSGTSYSAPIVSGLAAQLLTLNPDLTPAELEQRLEQTPSFVIDAPAGTTARHVYINLSGPRRRPAGR
jgi:subtilisin family serine protease